MRARARRMRQAAGSIRWVVFGIGSLDPPIDNKGDPHHGKERFKEPEHSGPWSVAIVLLFAVFTWASNTHDRLRNRLSVAVANCSRPRCIYEQAIPRGTRRYRSEIL
jgi:hypothetical protein